MVVEALHTYNNRGNLVINEVKKWWDQFLIGLLQIMYIMGNRIREKSIGSSEIASIRRMLAMTA